MYKACIIVLSDREYTGEEEDSAGRKFEKYLRNNNFEVLVYKIIPEVEGIYKKFLVKCCDNYGVDAVITISNSDISARVADEIREEENKELHSYRRKNTIIKNLKEDINNKEYEVQDIVESIKRI